MMIRIKLIVWNHAGGIEHQEINFIRGTEWKDDENKIYKLFPDDQKKQVSVYGENGLIKEVRNW